MRDPAAKAAYDREYKRVRRGLSRHSPAKARALARKLEEEGIEVRFHHNWCYLTGTLYEMPIEPSLDDVLADAKRAIEHAQSTRRAHARKTEHGTKQREADLKVAVERLQAAMKPIRRRICRLPYLQAPIGAEALEMASKELQRERRKLWKMRSSVLKKKAAARAKKRPRPYGRGRSYRG
jgi:hypothetical protein